MNVNYTLFQPLGFSSRYNTSGSYMCDDNGIQLYLAIIPEQVVTLFIMNMQADLAETSYGFIKESTLKNSKYPLEWGSKHLWLRD